MNQREVEKLRPEGDENITVQLLDKNNHIKLTKHFTIGHEAFAYAKNWTMLKEGNHYRIFDEWKRLDKDWKPLPLYECINCGAKGMKEDDVEADPTFWGNREIGYTCDHCGYVHYPNEGEFMIELEV